MEIEKPQNNDIEQIIDKFHDFISQDLITEAESFLLENIKQFPNNDDLAYEMGYFYYQQEDIEKAEQWLLKSIEINPQNNPEKYFTLANLYQNEKSISLYNYGIQIAKNDLNNLNEKEQQNLRRLMCQAYCSIFQILQEKESSENLMEIINQSFQIDPISLEPYQLLLSYHFNNIDEKNSRKTVNLFIEKLKEMQTNDLDEEFANYDVYFFLFFVRLMIEGAMWKETLVNDINHIEANYLLAFCYFQDEDYEKAMEICEFLKKLKILKCGDKELIDSYIQLYKEIKVSLQLNQLKFFFLIYNETLVKKFLIK